MCGIAGKISLTDASVSTEMAEAMCNAIRHRGPDDSGTYLSPNKRVALGHRRLAIIDLSPLGHQPMRYLDRYEIVFNGEIYNFQEERMILEKDGYAFKSHSDTEVILALYHKFGEKCLDHLRGMFAFAIYDEKEQVLFAARDRVGKKPFKYFFDGNTFMFASELKAILTQPEYVREPDYTAIHHYLTLQYVPAPLTGFKGIAKLEPGHFLRLNLRTKALEKKRYWKLDYSEKLDLSENEWKKHIIETLEESVKLRMISDVPIGAFLSGGVDSSAVVALMARNSAQPIKTFSIGFKEEKYNELPFAKQVAKKFSTDHTEFIIEPNAIELLPMLVRQYEEPFADSSALPTYSVAKLTREHVTVALNGDGGDENFAGYNSYAWFKMSLLLNTVSPIDRSLLYPIIHNAQRHCDWKFLHRLERVAKIMTEPPQRRFGCFMSHFDAETKKEMYTPLMIEKTSGMRTLDQFSRLWEESATSESLDRILYTDLNTYLPGALMPKVDIATMAVGLEGRSPFLDHKILELTAQLPNELKLKGFSQKKYILKKALEDLLPESILYRKKMGFGIPIHSWFRGELKEYIRMNLLSPNARIHQIIRKEVLERMLTEHWAGKRENGDLLWNLLALELWLKEYFYET